MNFRYAIIHLLITALGATALGVALTLAHPSPPAPAPAPMPAVDIEGWGAGSCAEDDYCFISHDGMIIARVHHDEVNPR